MLLLIAGLFTFVAGCMFYVIDRAISRHARNVALVAWLLVGILGVLVLLFLISRHPSDYDDLAKGIAAATGAAFVILGGAGAALAQLARRIWG